MTLPIEPDHRAYPLIHENKIVGLGLTKREYLAAIALQGLLANDHWESQLAAENAVNYADALIKELNK